MSETTTTITPEVPTDAAAQAPAPTPAAKPEAKATKKADTWLDRLKAEAKDLKERKQLLGEFIGTPSWDELPEIQRSLLKSQHTYQALLLDVLEQRIEAAKEA